MATEEILDKAINSSSIDNHFGIQHHLANARLNNAWCASIADKYIQFDTIRMTVSLDRLVLFRRVRSLMQGMLSRVLLSHSFSNDTIKWTFEEEPIGRQKVYKCLRTSTAMR